MQRVPWWKPTLIIAILIGSLLMLYPTFVWQRLSPDIRASLETPEMKGILAEIDQLKKEKALTTDESRKTELTHLIDEKDKSYKQKREWLTWYRAMSIHFGLDLQGGLRAVLKVNFEEKPTGDESLDKYNRQQTLQAVKLRLDKRINALGVAETMTQVQGDDRILIQLPGVTDRKAIYDVLGRTAKLDFKLVKTPNEVMETLKKIDEGMGENLSSKVNLQDGLVTFSKDDEAIFKKVLSATETRIYYPVDYMLAFGDEQGTVAEGQYIPLWLISETAEMTGKDITNAFPQQDMTGMGGMKVLLEFNNEGAAEFRDVTKRHVNELLAIVLDDLVYSAPRIQQEISGGRAEITGRFTPDEANNLAIVLRSGNLPAKVEIIETNIVGAYLGRDSVVAGIKAGLIGSVAVLAFVVIYYSYFGVVANFALLMNVLILVASMAALKATMTLPGIAGVFLIMGMAVDANVLINERIREERATGQERSLFALLSKGYSRAFSAILDGNVTTLITAIILFQFGTGPIKGFAVTLSMGIIISLFTALFVTRTIFDMGIAKGWIKKPRVGTITFFKETHFDFLKLGIPALVFSCLFIVAGLISSTLHGGFNLGIEFTGGTEITAAFDREVSVEEIRNALPKEIQATTIIQSNRMDPRVAFLKVKKTTPEETLALARQVEEAVVERLKSQARDNAPPEEYAVERATVADVVFSCLHTRIENAADDASRSSYRDVSPEVGAEITEQGFWAVAVSSILIILYMSWRFQFKYAVAAIIALLHDVLVTVGILALLQREFSLQIVAAILTVIGYSVNDTIVIFDRIRENRRLGTLDVSKIVNTSINQTLGRTIITGSTTLFMLISQMIWGGPVTFDFVLTLFVGIICGTYSSIFTASPILVILEERTRKKHLVTARA